MASDTQDNKIRGRVLSIVLIVAAIAAVAALFYTIENPIEEKFTEFYLLGIEGKADGYPSEFVMDEGKVTLVGYEYSSDDIQEVSEERGRLILGVINREQENATYRIEITIDGQRARVWLDGEWVDNIPITLAHEEKWEQEIGFTLQHIGDNQKVSFILYKDGQPYFNDPLHLWVNMKGAE